MKSLIKKIKVTYWYSGLLEINKFKTAYQLEKFYEPESFYYPEEGGTEYKNKWAKYRDGKHAPNAYLIGKVENKTHGSSSEFNHPLWQVLLLQRTCTVDLDYWFKQLGLETQLLFSGNVKKEGFLTKSRKSFDDFKLASKLLSQSNLDSLTALILYWHEAGLDDSSFFQGRLAKYIYKSLLIMAPHFEGRGISGEIYQVFSELIFKKTSWGGFIFCESFDYYHISYKVLNYEWCKANKASLEDINKSKMFGYRGVFDSAFSLMLLPNWIYGPPRKVDWIEWKDELTLWMWGWHALVEGFNINFNEFCNHIEQQNMMPSSEEFLNEFIFLHYGFYLGERNLS